MAHNQMINLVMLMLNQMRSTMIMFISKKKYKLTDETITYKGRILRRIEALKDLSGVKKGDKGGFIESENNLSHKDNCWIYNNAMVYGDANISGNAGVFDDARIYGDAWVSGNASIFGNAKVYGSAWVREEVRIYDNVQVFGNEHICGAAEIGGDATVVSMSDYIVFKNWWSSGRYFTWTRSNNMWNVGCFHGTGEELIAKAYKDSELSGKEYERVVKYVELILKDSNTTTRINRIKQCLIKITGKIKLLRFKKLED